MTLGELLDRAHGFEYFTIEIDTTKLYPNRKSTVWYELVDGLYKKEALNPKYLDYTVLDISPVNAPDTWALIITIEGRKEDK